MRGALEVSYVDGSEEFFEVDPGELPEEVLGEIPGVLVGVKRIVG